MHVMFAGIARGLTGLDGIGDWIGLLGVRLLLAYEFGLAGLMKLRGENWFADIGQDLPFPFAHLPVDLSWTLATWTELIGAMALVLGLGTRFWAFALLVVDLVAWASVHAGNGYNGCDNGYQLPLMYLVMLLPLVLFGPGRLSVDHAVRAYLSKARA